MGHQGLDNLRSINIHKFTFYQNWEYFMGGAKCHSHVDLLYKFHVFIKFESIFGKGTES